MYRKRYAKRFKTSIRKILKSGHCKQEEIDIIIEIIASGKTLDRKYRDHALTGEYRGYRECHIKPDMLLIYKIEKDILILVLADIGSHANLFGI